MFANLFSRFAPAPDPNAVEHDELQRSLDTGGCHLVDVREAGEFASGHIPQSTNMPMSSFDPRRLPRGKAVVLICRSGMRSGVAIAKAAAAGRADIRHYAGGLIAWRSRGGALSY